MEPRGTTPAAQTSQPCLGDPGGTAYTEDIIPHLITQKPPPRSVPYQPPIIQSGQTNQMLDKGKNIRGTL